MTVLEAIHILSKKFHDGQIKEMSIYNEGLGQVRIDIRCMSSSLIDDRYGSESDDGLEYALLAVVREMLQ